MLATLLCCSPRLGRHPYGSYAKKTTKKRIFSAAASAAPANQDKPLSRHKDAPSPPRSASILALAPTRLGRHCRTTRRVRLVVLLCPVRPAPRRKHARLGVAKRGCSTLRTTHAGVHSAPASISGLDSDPPVQVRPPKAGRQQPTTEAEAPSSSAFAVPPSRRRQPSSTPTRTRPHCCSMQLPHRPERLPRGRQHRPGWPRAAVQPAAGCALR